MENEVKPYNPGDSKKEQVATMFNRIARTYDFLNHFLSLGIDIIWRKKAIGELRKDQPKLILDVATGTGDFAFEALSILKPEKIIGVDISEGMLEIAREKIRKRGLEDKIEVRLGDSEKLLFPDTTFDAVTVSFGVRNFENLEQGLRDICRVLKTEGKAVVLEFSNPKAFPVKQLYRFYSFRILPLFGRVFSKDPRAYTYLPESVAAFPDGERFLDIMRKAGFKTVKHRSLGFGICAIYTGVK
jgi:demethylmenaquinone methyltransferase/2-methoxy-6-polyprenyl-1,4-benzoquinol methylase